MTSRPPKPRTVVVDGRTFERIPVGTRVLLPGDDIAGAIREHAGGQLHAGDAILLVAKANGTNKRWSVVSNDGCSLSTV